MCVYVFPFFVLYHKEISFFFEASFIAIANRNQYSGVKFLNIFFWKQNNSGIYF